MSGEGGCPWSHSTQPARAEPVEKVAALSSFRDSSSETSCGHAQNASGAPNPNIIKLPSLNSRSTANREEPL